MYKIVSIFILGMALFLGGCGSSSEDQKTSTADDTLTDQAAKTSLSLSGEMFIESPSIINIVFSAVDQNGNGVTDLVEGDFNITEDHEPISARESFFRIEKKNTTFQENVLFLLDVSTSITLAQLATMKQALKDYVYNSTTGLSNLRKNTRVGIRTFAQTTRTIIGFTDDVDALLAAIDTIGIAEPTTSLYGAYISSAESLINRYSYSNLQHSTLVVLTDGKDQAGYSTLDAALAAKKENTVFVIHIATDEADRTVSEQLASKNRVYDIEDFTEVASALDGLNTFLDEYSNSFYHLVYASPKRFGTHEVAVSVENATLTATFDADGFGSVEPELIIPGLDQNGSLSVGQQHVIEADILWTLPENIDAETFAWSSSDESVVKIVSTDTSSQAITVEFLASGEANLTLSATNLGLSKTVTLSNITFNPYVRSNPKFMGRADKIHVMGDYAFIDAPYEFNNDQFGFAVVDISDRDAPVVVAAPVTAGWDSSVKTVGTYAYATQREFLDTDSNVFGFNGVEIFDISDIANPVSISQYVLPGTPRGEASIVDGYLYVGHENGMQIVDVRDMADPRFAGEYNSTGYLGQTIAGNYAFCETNTTAVTIVDVSDPANPSALSVYEAEYEIRAIKVIGNALYINAGYLLKVDITDPAAPTLAGSSSVSNIYNSTMLTIDGDYLYVGWSTNNYLGSSHHIDVVDIRDPNAAKLKYTYTFDPLGDLGDYNAVTANLVVVGDDILVSAYTQDVIIIGDGVPKELDYFYLKE